MARLPIYAGSYESLQLKYGLDMRKPAFRVEDNKSADQPAHQHSLISAFVILLLKSIKSIIATSDISFFQLVWAEQAALGMTWSETPKTGCLALRPIREMHKNLMNGLINLLFVVVFNGILSMRYFPCLLWEIWTSNCVCETLYTKPYACPWKWHYFS